ncbi:hypothetical protein [Caldisphaera sp.]|uniref:hypothetical protein n=1 Tax=Caldisphaera sp. TaxID=2060322 RepID=UPI0025C1079E|nr:hypothetical protein [Caldisphaera sp.]
MVGRKFITIKCFNGEKPYINLKLQNIKLDEFELSLRLDTGFDGTIMLTDTIYKYFEVGELPEDSWFRFKTLNGYVIMKTSRALIDFGNKKMETYVLSPRDFEGKNLIGIGVLKELSILIDKVKETCTVNEIL